MEKFELTLQSEQVVHDHINGSTWMMANEREIMTEILAIIKRGDADQLTWIAGFGEDFRHITMNLNQYRKGLEFGFTGITFDKSGWLTSAKFLNFEDIELGESSVRIGRGPNGLWAYALRCNYGTAGSSSPLCVFCKKYPNRDTALSAALKELEVDMLSKVNHADRSNYHQDLISKTLKAITKTRIGLVQLTLF